MKAAYLLFTVLLMSYNALSYILKPVMECDIRAALNKISKIKHPVEIKNVDAYIKNLSHGLTTFLNRILLECGIEIFPVEVSEICFFESEFRSVTVYLKDGRQGVFNQMWIILGKPEMESVRQFSHHHLSRSWNFLSKR